MNDLKKILIVALLIIFGCKEKTNRKVESGSKPEITTALLKLTDLSNVAIDLDKYKGKTVFINFWATWCKPCREEMPSIQNTIEVLKNENIEFIFASNESSELVEDFKSGHDYGFNYVLANNLEELNIMGLPTTFIFNPDGNLVFSETGYRKWDDKENIDLILNIIKHE